MKSIRPNLSSTRPSPRSISGAIAIIAALALLGSGAPAFGAGADTATGTRLSGAVTATPDLRTGRDDRRHKSGKQGKSGDKSTKPKKHKKKKDRFKPRQGLTFASPFKTPYGINKKVLNAINHTRRGAKIRMMAWNVDAWTYVRALTAAHRRGVSVRLIMARSLYREGGPAHPAHVLSRALSKNKGRPAAMKSWLRTCDHSCRGKGGSMHAKFYTFSRTGNATNVVMSASANLTATAGMAQWNDMITLVDRPATYAAYKGIFNQAAQDKPADYFQAKDGKFLHWFYPRVGRSDMVLDMLNRVSCTGAVGAGINGRTSVRIAQDVFNANRGVILAKKVRQLHRRGCNVKVVFSQAVGGAGEIIAQVPNNHLVQDRDGDGAYDIYLHAKALAISGNYNGDPGHHVVLNGTANWSGLAVMSDENGMIIEGKRYEQAYAKWVNGMFGIKLRSARPNPILPRAVDPYVNMER